MNIKILDEQTINKIAAGEVIERPSSVVKELIENSIDAGADNIIVEVKDGGKTFIRVTDNGSGMDKEDALLSYHKHATSKLNDLFDIHTLGFRGEALSSISAVSNFILKTNGTQLEIEGGKLLKESQLGMNQGTIIEVSDLFYNTPARKNYLKSREVEFSHIQDIIIRYSLSNKDISIKLIHDEKEIITTPKTNDLLNKIVDIYGKDIAKNMVKIEQPNIQGYIGKPYVTKADRSMQTIFINHRYVKNETISRAIYDAYHTLLFLDRHPVIILNIDIDFTKIDVNVHPTKEVIRLENEQEIYEQVFVAFRKTFKENNLVPEVELSETNRQVKQNYDIANDSQTVLQTKEEQQEYKENPEVKSSLGNMRIIGQLNRMYILAENEQGLLLIDQHALQERINFEKLMTQIDNENIEKQTLLQPLTIELGINEFRTFQTYENKLKELGFEVEEYGHNTIRVTELPKMFSTFDKETIKELIYDLETIDKIKEDKIETKIARKACRMSIKAGKEMNAVEMNHLIRQAEFCKDPYSCPHGRPTMISITLGELEKKFKRAA